MTTLMPQNYMIYTNFNKKKRDDMAYIWMNRIQGIYKSKQVISRFLKLHKQ